MRSRARRECIAMTYIYIGAGRHAAVEIVSGQCIRGEEQKKKRTVRRLKREKRRDFTRLSDFDESLLGDLSCLDVLSIQ